MASGVGAAQRGSGIFGTTPIPMIEEALLVSCGTPPGIGVIGSGPCCRFGRLCLIGIDVGATVCEVMTGQDNGTEIAQCVQIARSEGRAPCKLQRCVHAA